MREFINSGGLVFPSGSLPTKAKRRKHSVAQFVLDNTDTGTPRRFRDWHRRRVSFAARAADLALSASAWGPAAHDIEIALNALRRAVEQTSRANWGR